MTLAQAYERVPWGYEVGDVGRSVGGDPLQICEVCGQEFAPTSYVAVWDRAHGDAIVALVAVGPVCERDFEAAYAKAHPRTYPF